MTENEKDNTNIDENLEPTLISFKCTQCFLEEKCDYFGDDPSFARCYKLLERSYVMKDPFSDPKFGNFIIIGSPCIKCNSTVCKDINCSFYYNGTYCLQCAKSYCHTFPVVLQEKINKMSGQINLEQNTKSS